VQNAQEFLPPENYTSKHQKILTTAYTEEVKIFIFWFSMLFLCALCVLSGSSLFGSGYAGLVPYEKYLVQDVEEMINRYKQANRE